MSKRLENPNDAQVSPFANWYQTMSIGQFPLQQILVAQIHSAVVHNPHLNHRRMHIKTKQGRVIIDGTVDSFFQKQMAQEALRGIEGVKSIENRLEVNWN